MHSQNSRFRADKFFSFKICSDSEMSLEPKVSETRKSEPLQSLTTHVDINFFLSFFFQSLKEETVSPPPQTPVSSVPPHLLNGGGVGGPMNSTEMATPDSASQGVNGKKSKKKKRHISDMEDHPPATPIAMPSLGRNI